MVQVLAQMARRVGHWLKPDTLAASHLEQWVCLDAFLVLSGEHMGPHLKRRASYQRTHVWCVCVARRRAVDACGCEWAGASDGGRQVHARMAAQQVRHTCPRELGREVGMNGPRSGASISSEFSALDVAFVVWCRNRFFDTWHNIPLAFLIITATLVRAPDSVKQMHLTPPRYPSLGIGISVCIPNSGVVKASSTVHLPHAPCPCVCVCPGAGVAW
jgi:hypothetical protein